MRNQNTRKGTQPFFVVQILDIERIQNGNAESVKVFL